MLLVPLCRCTLALSCQRQRQGQRHRQTLAHSTTKASSCQESRDSSKWVECETIMEDSIQFYMYAKHGLQSRGNRRDSEGINAQPKGETSRCLKGNKRRAKRQGPTLPGMGLPLKSSNRSWMSRPLDTSISLGGF